MHVLQFVKVAMGESYIAQFLFSPWSTQNTTYRSTVNMHADQLDSDSVGHYISQSWLRHDEEYIEIYIGIYGNNLNQNKQAMK